MLPMLVNKIGVISKYFQQNANLFDILAVHRSESRLPFGSLRSTLILSFRTASIPSGLALREKNIK